jgi:hypothetical protein
MARPRSSRTAPVFDRPPVVRTADQMDVLDRERLVGSRQPRRQTALVRTAHGDVGGCHVALDDDPFEAQITEAAVQPFDGRDRALRSMAALGRASWLT